MAVLLLLTLRALILHIPHVGAAVNLFISNSEVKRILGFDAELYYIRRSEEKTNAIAHQLMVAENINQVNFQWIDEQPVIQTATNPVIFSSTLYAHDKTLIENLSTNLLGRGRVPRGDNQGFHVNVTCKPDVTGSSLVYLQLNLTVVGVENQSFNLNLSFNKLCKKVTTSTGGHIDAKKEKVTDEDNGQVLPGDYEETTSDGSKTNTFYIAVGVACSLILIIATAVGFLHVHSMPKPVDESQQGLVNNEEQIAEAHNAIPKVVKAAIAEKQQKEMMYHLKDFIIRRNLLTLGNTIQEGSFGRAYIGMLINAESGEEFKVLVKSVTDQASPEQVTLFMAESSMLKRTTHHNVLPLMHICCEEGRPPLIIYPYVNRGNLKNYLRLTRTAEPLSKPLTTRDIVLMALQIAQGLQYLTRRRMVHKDVATRNCVVDEELHVKVSDNALARDFFPGDYHCLGDNENRPVRWMAVESLESNTFMMASDVWSYGVLLWELSSLAQTPYANVDPFEMHTYLKDGLRLPQPANCPDDLFTVMACCWALSPEERPHFTQIIACLEAFLNKLNAFI